MMKAVYTPLPSTNVSDVGNRNQTIGQLRLFQGNFHILLVFRTSCQ